MGEGWDKIPNESPEGKFTAAVAPEQVLVFLPFSL